MVIYFLRKPDQLCLRGSEYAISGWLFGLLAI